MAVLSCKTIGVRKIIAVSLCLRPFTGNGFVWNFFVLKHFFIVKSCSLKLTIVRGYEAARQWMTWNLTYFRTPLIGLQASIRRENSGGHLLLCFHIYYAAVSVVCMLSSVKKLFSVCGKQSSYIQGMHSVSRNKKCRDRYARMWEGHGTGIDACRMSARKFSFLRTFPLKWQIFVQRHFSHVPQLAT